MTQFQYKAQPNHSALLTETATVLKFYALWLSCAHVHNYRTYVFPIQH